MSRRGRVLAPDEPVAVALTEAIRSGDVEALERVLACDPDLAAARIGDAARSRPLLGVATDWPGHLPRVGDTIAALIRAGADVDAPYAGPEHRETPLHWAASSDDLAALDALLDAGADIEAPGAVIAGGTPLDDAVAFRQWQAARRLVERGAQTALWHAAALGLLSRVAGHLDGATLPARHPWGAGAPGGPPRDVDVAFWSACHGGQRATAELLLGRGADLNWVAVWDGHTPLDAARRSGASEVEAWLLGRGARAARDPA